MTSGGLSVVCTSCAKTSGRETPSNCSQTQAAKLLRCLSHGSRIRSSGGLDAEPDGGGSSFGGGPPPLGAAGLPSSPSSSSSSPSSPSGSPRPRPRPAPRPRLRRACPRPPPRPRGPPVGSPAGRCPGLPVDAAGISDVVGLRPVEGVALGPVLDCALPASASSPPAPPEPSSRPRRARAARGGASVSKRMPMLGSCARSSSAGCSPPGCAENLEGPLSARISGLA